MTTATFTKPCLATAVDRLPQGPGWIHEPKLDGWRIQLVKVGEDVKLYTRTGGNWADRMPGLVEELRRVPVDACAIDGELVADEDNRLGDVFSVSRAIAAGKFHLMSVMAFDLLICEGEDLRQMPLIDRKALLVELVERAKLPCLSYVAGFVDGKALFETMDALGLEGVVSKKTESKYRSGRSRDWVKIKTPIWRERNRERWKIFQLAK